MWYVIAAVVASPLGLWWESWMRRRAEAKAFCLQYGHDWGAPFTAIGVKHRNCQRCKTQQHHYPDDDTWR